MDGNIPRSIGSLLGLFTGSLCRVDGRQLLRRDARIEKDHRQFTERNGRKLEKAIHEEWTPDKGGLTRL
jgi:hypothetical protein